jgi:hypothetical protein
MSGYSPENRGRFLCEIAGDCQNRLRMADEQKTGYRKIVHQVFQYPLPSCLIEVDHYVSAENIVKPPLEIDFLVQIQAFDFQEIAQALSRPPRELVQFIEVFS